MYTVIYSKSPYLLARMATDLQMGGMWKTFTNADYFHPFSGMDKETANDLPCRWIAIYDQERFGCYNHTCSEERPITLTARNYLKVLGAILNSKK